MPEITTHLPGSFCWAELSTTDTAGAKKFYNGLFGWDSVDNPMGPDMVYTILNLHGLNVGGLYSQMEDQKQQGIPPNWLLYVQVDKVEDAMEKAKQLGGQVIMGPIDVATLGRMAVIAGPEGAVFGVWQPLEHKGFQVENEPGTLCWSEVMTKEIEKSKAFYLPLFGWTAKESTGAAAAGYTEIMLQGRPIGGMLPMGPEFGPTPSNWMPYFAVADCAASTTKASELGASVMMGPKEIPNTGTFSVLTDPQGAHFAIFQYLSK
jgi:predicted enzyme related to lactoylglutathione lyase